MVSPLRSSCCLSIGRDVTGRIRCYCRHDRVFLIELPDRPHRR